MDERAGEREAIDQIATVADERPLCFAPVRRTDTGLVEGVRHLPGRRHIDAISRDDLRKIVAGDLCDDPTQANTALFWPSARFSIANDSANGSSVITR